MQKDITEFCRTCINCQSIRPIRPSQGLLPILHLMPLDCMGIDFIGPFTPVARSGARYICIGVDYFSRFMWGKALPVANSANTIRFFEESVTNTFGWPRIVYSDNGRHFQGKFKEKLSAMKVKQIGAPITHPESVGLAERYIKLILNELRTLLQHDPNFIWDWDWFVPHVIHAANTRLVKLYGYTPAQLLMGFNPTYNPDLPSFEDELRGTAFAENIQEWINGGYTLEEATYHLRLAAIDEMRDRATDRRLQEAQRIMEKTEKSESQLPVVIRGIKWPQKGDLVLVKRLELEEQKSHKLEARNEGPFRVSRVSEKGKSAWVCPLQSNKEKGKYSVNDLAPFLPRNDFDSDDRGWRTVAKINQEIKDAVKKYMKKRREEKKARGLDLDRNEDEDLPDVPSDLHQPFEDGYGEEGDPMYWKERQVDLYNHQEQI